MNKEFVDGVRYFGSNMGTSLGINISNEYLNDVYNAIDEFSKYLNEEYVGNGRGVAQLKGNLAEDWHANTANISAIANDSSKRFFVPKSNDFASADIVGSDGIKYGLKYDKTAQDTVIQQSKSYNSAINSKAYSVKREDVSDDELFNSIYHGQMRLVPSDQYDECIELLDRIIADKTNKGSIDVSRFIETREKLIKCIDDGNGIKSIELTKSDAELLAAAAKEGNVTNEFLENLGVTLNNFVTAKSILIESLKSGLTAGTMTLILELTPVIISCINYVLKNSSKADLKKFKEKGLSAISDSGKSFIMGTLTNAVITSAKSGKLGEGLADISSTTIGMTVAIVFTMIKETFMLVKSEQTGFEYVSNVIEKSLSLLVGYNLGKLIVSLVKFKFMGFILGNIVGNILAGFVFTTGKTLLLSLCVNDGFTMFGLVKQDYTLPVELLEELGVDVVKYDKTVYDKTTIDKINVDRINIDKTNVDTMNIRVLRRGFIEVNRVGYIF